MNVLIIKLSSLGDLFHALPTVHNLKTKLNAEIDWVVTDQYLNLMPCFSDVRRAIPFYRSRFFARLPSFLSDLRRSKYDYIIDLQGLLKSALTARLARGHRRIGPSFHREGSRLFYQSVAGKRNKQRHAVEEMLDVVDFLHLDRSPVTFPVAFPEPPPHLLPEERPAGPLIGILPASRWETKNWPEAHFAALAGRLAQHQQATILVLGGPDEVDACGRIQAAAGRNAINCAGRCSLPELGGLLQKLDLLIANDSGPVHMAAAVNTPSLVLFGPTSPERTGPYGDPHHIVSTTADCRPCYGRTCASDRPLHCLGDITPERVEAEALAMLKAGAGPR